MTELMIELPSELFALVGDYLNDYHPDGTNLRNVIRQGLCDTRPDHVLSTIRYATRTIPSRVITSELIQNCTKCGVKDLSVPRVFSKTNGMMIEYQMHCLQCRHDSDKTQCGACGGWVSWDESHTETTCETYYHTMRICNRCPIECNVCQRNLYADDAYRFSKNNRGTGYLFFCEEHVPDVLVGAVEPCVSCHTCNQRGLGHGLGLAR